MSISSGDVVCVLPTCHCRLYPAATVFGAPGTSHPIHTGFVQLAQQRQNQDSICKCRFVSRLHNISGFEDCWGIAAKFELEDLFQLVISSSCCDEPLKQQLWIALYCFIVDFGSWCTECGSLVFFLKPCCNTLCCAIDVKIFFATSFAVSTFTPMTALIPVAMLRKLQLSLNMFRDSRNCNSSHESVIYFPCLAVAKSLCCSFILYYIPVSCCIALFTSAQTGCAIKQTRRWVSVMPRPLVKPPLRMRTYSMTKSGGKSCPEPIWYAYSVEPLIELSGNLWMGFMKHMHLLQVCTCMHFVYKLCPEAAK